MTDLHTRIGEWQPIETAPKHGAAILLVSKRLSGSPRVVIGRWLQRSQGLQRWGEAETNAPVGEPTHWRPLPDPPAAETKPMNLGHAIRVRPD